MGNELAIIPRTLPEVTSLAELLAKSKLLPDDLRNNPANVAVQILAGQELGLSPMAAIRGVHVVQGKPLLAADTMVGLCLSSGLAEYFSCIEETPTSVTYETKRKGSPHPQRFTWSDEDTKLAGLNTKDNWRLHKRQMRRARCKAVLARDVYPDVLAGVYDENEIQVPAREPTLRPVQNNADAVDAEVVSDDVEALLKAVDDAPTLDELTALEPQLKQLTNGHKVEAKRRYAARRDWLRNAAAAPATPATEPEVA